MILGAKVIPSVDTWGNTFNFFEVLYKIALVMETGCFNNICNGPLFVKHENFGPLNPLAGKKVHGGYTGMFLEDATEVMLAHCRLPGQLFQADIF